MSLIVSNQEEIKKQERIVLCFSEISVISVAGTPFTAGQLLARGLLPIAYCPSPVSVD